MTQIVKKEKAKHQLGTWDPFQMMRSWMHWDPFRDLPTFKEGPLVDFVPDFEVKESAEGFVFKGDLPGIKDKDLEISVSGNMLTIAGKREEERQEKGERYYTYERSYGRFSRSFTLPEGTDTDNIHADLNDGVLVLAVPKTGEVKPKKITIKKGEKH